MLTRPMHVHNMQPGLVGRVTSGGVQAQWKFSADPHPTKRRPRNDCRGWGARDTQGLQHGHTRALARIPVVTSLLSWRDFRMTSPHTADRPPSHM
jgi:hypothetical protein